MSTKVYAAGELLVTGHGEVVIDELVPKSRALLVHPERYIEVEFDPNEPPPPPCSGHAVVDALEWELFFLPVRHHGPRHRKPEEEMRLKICWSVSSSRTVIWKIKIPG